MSEATRARRQFIVNRLEELDTKLGYNRGPLPVSFEVDPSWGPLGSLARQLLTPAEYAALVQLDAEIAALERQRRVEDSQGWSQPMSNGLVTHGN